MVGYVDLFIRRCADLKDRKEALMRTYEMTVILRIAEEDFTKGKQQLNELLERNGVTVEKLEDQGNRVLAYQINKEEKGHYLYFEVRSDPSVIIQLERALKLMQPVLKFLIVRKDEHQQKAPKKSVKPAAETVPEPEAPAAEAAEEPAAEPEEGTAEVQEEAPAEPVEEASVETDESAPEQDQPEEETKTEA